MTWTLAEQLVDDLVSYFDTNLPGRLDLIDAEIGGSITLADITGWDIAEAELDSVQSWPRGVILVPNTTLLEWRGAQVKGKHGVLIGILVLDQDKGDLRRRLYRYGRAIFEELVDAHGDGAFTWDVGLGATIINFSPLFTNAPGQFVADVQIEVQLQKTEVR